MPTRASRLVIGENVRRQRKARGLTQVQLAEMSDKPQSRIAEIESGRYSISADSIDEIADVLGIAPAALLMPVDIQVPEKV